MATLRWKKARNARPDIQASIVYSGDYVISLRHENFTVSYRPDEGTSQGRHVGLGSYGTLASAKKAAGAHAEDPAAFEALLHANMWGTPSGYVPPGHMKNRAGLSAERKRSPMLGGGTLADYEAAARMQQQAGGTLATGGRQTVAMTPGGTIVMNRARRQMGQWGFYARRWSDDKTVRVSRKVAEEIAESPAGGRQDYAVLWLVPPFYMDAGEGRYRAEKGFVPVAWESHLGKRELPDDFLGDPRAWLERVKREDYPTYERSEVGASPWNLGTLGARRRARGLRSTNMASGGRIQVDEITAPAAWASALVNGDYSGLDEEDAKALERWLKHTLPKGWSVVDTARDEQGEGKEARFTWSYRLYGGAAEGGDVLDYVIHRVPRARRKVG